jgi:hypothetical protein
MSASAFTVAAAAARGGATVGGGTLGGGRCLCSGKYRKLFFNIAAAAFFALYCSSGAGNEFFKCQTALLADIFIYRHTIFS